MLPALNELLAGEEWRQWEADLERLWWVLAWAGAGDWFGWLLVWVAAHERRAWGRLKEPPAGLVRVVWQVSNPCPGPHSTCPPPACTLQPLARVDEGQLAEVLAAYRAQQARKEAAMVECELRQR